MTAALLTVAQIAVRLGVSERHIYRLIDAGELAAVLVGKRALRVSSEALEIFLSTRTCLSAKTLEAAGTLKFATGGKEFIASALATRQRHRRRPLKAKSARIYSLPARAPRTT